MSDEIWRRDEVLSPCVKVCVIHPASRLCVGCLRTIDEITAWSTMPDTDRRAVMAALPGRAPLIAQRRGGRAARIAGTE